MNMELTPDAFININMSASGEIKMQDNIIKFPPKNIDNETFPSTLEESLETLVSIRTEFCDEVVADTLDAITAVFASYGFALNSEIQTIKDIVFVEEALKAFTYRYKKLDHPFHPLIDETITVSDDIKKQIEEKIENNKH